MLMMIREQLVTGWERLPQTEIRDRGPKSFSLPQILMIVGVALILGASSANALSFQQGDGGSFSTTEATFVRETSPGTNYGSATWLLSDGDGEEPNLPNAMALIQYLDLMGASPGQVPLNPADIVSASLRLRSRSESYAAGGQHSIHRMLTSWDEDVLVWSDYGGSPLPGTDFFAVPASSLVPNALETYFTFDVTSIVTAWASGATNNGFAVVSDTADAALWYSDDIATQAFRPLLTVTIVPEPSTVILVGAGLLSFAVRRRSAVGVNSLRARAQRDIRRS